MTNFDHIRQHFLLPPVDHRFPLVISGPCSAETPEQLLTTARLLAQNGKIDVLRAGIWKPRTKPGGFEGVGRDALPWLLACKKETGLKTTVEVATPEHVELAMQHEVDMLWIGARTTTNPFAVDALAQAMKNIPCPVLIKNPMNPDVDLWDGAVQRLQRAGVERIGLLHRGFSSYGKSAYRNPPQWQIALEMQQRYPQLPMLCDPSHICGNTTLIQHTAQHALDLNYAGLMLEAHYQPEKAWSDAEQQLHPDALLQLLHQLVVRTSLPDKERLAEALAALRKKVDLLDSHLIDVLAQRMETIREIAAYKKKHHIKILQAERWEKIVGKCLHEAQEKGLQDEFIRQILSAIHLASIEQQHEVMNKD